MDLFAIERYQGDDAKPEATGSADKSSHLQRLLSKIEEKKKLAAEVQKKKLLAKKKFESEAQKAEFLEKAKLEAENAKSKTKKAKKKKKKAEMKDLLKAGQVSSGQFTILGDDSLGTKNAKVHAQLPHWLASPSLVSVDLQNLTVSVDDIPQLDKDLVQRLRRNKITHFFPVQHQIIPCLLEAQGKPLHFWPRDICVSAPTGSGKTFAFVLPIVQALRSRFVPHVRALIILPVKDLAAQVCKVFREYSQGITDLKIVLINGKDSFEKEQSRLVHYSEADEKFHSCADIIVTTPGRLVDHLQLTKGFSLQHLKYLVIDEADRVIASMQNDWLYHLEKHLYPDQKRTPPLNIQEITIRRRPPQKLLFSATLTKDPEVLQELGLFQPRLFTSNVKGGSSDQNAISSLVGKLTTPAELTEQWVSCNLETKPLYLYHLISEGNWNSVIVFTNSVVTVHRLAILMKHLLKDSKIVEEASAALDDKDRSKILKKISSGAINVLVCSDVFARGIDIPTVDCVISYDCPKYITNYIHRVGRTGRAGRQGIAITLLLDKQKSMFMGMMKEAQKEDLAKEKVVDISSIEVLEDKYKNALASLKTDLEIEQTKAPKKFTSRVAAKPAHYKKGKKFDGVRNRNQALKNKVSNKLSKLAKKKKLR